MYPDDEGQTACKCGTYSASIGKRSSEGIIDLVKNKAYYYRDDLDDIEKQKFKRHEGAC